MEQETLAVRRLISGAALIMMGGLAVSGEPVPDAAVNHDVETPVALSLVPSAEVDVLDHQGLLRQALQQRRASRSRPAAPKPTVAPIPRPTLAPTPKPTDVSLPNIVDDPGFVRLRYCESTNTPNINTGNGFYGAYQFDQATWEEYGGTQFASRADLASLNGQTVIAAKLRSARGYQPWPDCSRKLGLR